MSQILFGTWLMITLGPSPREWGNLQIVCASGTNLLSTPLPLGVAAEEVRRPREDEPLLRKGDSALEDREG